MSNVETAKAAYQAFNDGDLATMRGTWADDVHWWNSDAAQLGGERAGADEVMAMIMEMPTHWKDARISPTDFLADGDYVVVRGTQHFENGNGSADVKFAHVLRFDAAGKCVDAEMHTDSAKLAALQG